MSAAVWRSGSSGTPSLAAGSPASANSRWSELPAAGVGHPAHRAAACANDPALDARAIRARAEVERGAAPDLVEAEDEAEVGGALLDARDGGERAEMVGLARCTAAPRRRWRSARRRRRGRSCAAAVRARRACRRRTRCRRRRAPAARSPCARSARRGSRRACRSCRPRCASGRARPRGSGRGRSAVRRPGTASRREHARGARRQSPRGGARRARVARESEPGSEAASRRILGGGGSAGAPARRPRRGRQRRMSAAITPTA